MFLRRWRFFAALSFALAWLASPARAADRLDTVLEKIIGKPVAWALVEASGTDDDPLLLNWVRGVGGQVARQAPRQDVPYSFRILGTSVANAQAAPGGYIFVTRGLLDEIESDDELAGVLAHESAHVSKRHATQQIGENLLVLLLISQIHGKNADNYRTAAQVYNALRVLNKSREQEAQADMLGLSFAQTAGYDPNGLVRFFERLEAGGREPGRLQQYLATHPSPRQRVRTARENPVVRKSDPALREATAAGYEARGLRASAAALRAGRDPLRLPPLPPFVLLAPDAAVARRQVWDRANENRRRLTGAFRAQQVGGALQQILLVNYQLDLRWVYLAARVYSIQTDAQDVYARTLRVLRTAPSTYDALAATTEPDTAENVRRGELEATEAVRRAGDAIRPLTRASQAAAAVLTDLNNPLYHPKGGLAWARYGALEGLLRYAETELGRADHASGSAWRALAFARIRRYEAHISHLAPEGDPARRALFADLAARRILGDASGAAFPGSADLPAGGAAIQAALSVELNQPLELVAAGRGDTPWADWVRASKNSVPENIATVLRLLSLDLERETFLLDDKQPPTPAAALPDAADATPTAAD